MSIECGECERDLRSGHEPGCSRNGKRPSDRAIAQAFWEWRTRSNYFRAKYSASIWVEERARELDATAAPVVVGEDVARYVLTADYFGKAKMLRHDVSGKWVKYEDHLAALTAALAGD